MFDYLAMSYKDSDYTILVLKLTLMVELRVLCLPVNRHCSSAPLQQSLAVQLSGKAHEYSNYTAMIAIMHWHLRAKN